MSNLSKLTLIIPSLNRQAYALRNARYWSGRDATVHVIDGTSRPLGNSELKGLGENIHYHHLPASLGERLAFGATLIDTAYAALCGDDEFFPPSGVEACMSHLEHTPDETACCGRIVGFFLDGHSLALKPVKTFHRDHSVDQPSLAERVKYHLGNFMVTTIYGVHRADSLRRCLAFSGEENFSSPYVAETLFELLAAAQGKSSVIANLSWLRSYENRPVETRQFDRSRSLSDWYDDKRSQDEVRRFYELVRRAVGTIAPADEIEDAWRATVEALQLRISADRVTQSSAPKRGKLRRTLGKMIRPTRARLARLARRPSAETAGDYYASPTDYSYERLKRDGGIIVDDAELGEILETVRRFQVREGRLSELPALSQAAPRLQGLDAGRTP